MPGVWGRAPRLLLTTTHQVKQEGIAIYTAAIIDDEPWVISGIRNALDWESCGFEIVLEEFDPFEAQRKVLAVQPHLILIDIKMPGLSGLDFIKQCRNQGVTSHFVIISAYNDFQFAKTAIPLGVSDYLLKPIEKSELRFCVEMIREELNRQINLPNYNLTEELPKETYDFQCLLKYVNQNYCEDMTLSLLEKKFFFTNTYICDLFRKELSTTFTKYINDLRLKKSYQMLADTDLGIGRIAFECGFGNSSYFAKLFREKYGITPNMLRAKREHFSK